MGGGRPRRARLSPRPLGAGLGARLPYFEILLGVNLAGSVSANYDIVTHRWPAAAPTP